MCRVPLILVMVVCAGCGVAGGDRPNVCLPIEGGLVSCSEADVTQGPVCLEEVDTDQDFEAIAAAGLALKYMLPARDDPDLLPLVFQNSRCNRLHLEFLSNAFPDRFGALNPQTYLELIMTRASRSYFAGGIQIFDDFTLGTVYGFGVWTDLSDPAELLTLGEVRTIYQKLAERFGPQTLAYAPTDNPAIARARSWIEPDFPVYLGFDEVRTEVYTAGTAYGYLKLYEVSDFERALREGQVGWRDIVVIDRVPFDVEAVVAAVVTGGRQWELSHVNVRMARRSTPNLYIRDALEALGPHAGQLVRIEAIRGFAGGADRYVVEPAELAEADAWWSSHRPSAGALPAVDPSERRLLSLGQMGEAPDPGSLVESYGGKATNLAVLYRVLPVRYQVPGFAIPFAWFEAFMGSNTLFDRRFDPPEEVSYREYVARLAADEQVRTDAVFRRALLWDLRARIRSEALIDPELPGLLLDRIGEVFGGTGTKVRFRSSSNVEDALEFSGAGLYNSTSVCAADSLDGDLDGPSLCDPGQDEERSVERGLRRVWAGLFNDRAWEERDWYQVPHGLSSMAILVTLAFPDELANGVAFTGNPGYVNDSRYLVNVQFGDEAVVGNDPALVPEKDLLALQDGLVTRIYRERESALAGPGEFVLSDDQLRELGGLLDDVAQRFELDTGDWTAEQVLLDLEFKVDRADGGFKIKQIRPFLEKCRGVTCTQPPLDACLDEWKLQEYNSFGACDALWGSCGYLSQIIECEQGCLDGACLE